MYNRYIPQPDGSYRRNRMPEVGNEERRSAPMQPPAHSPEPTQEECRPEPEIPPCQKGQPCAHMRTPSRPTPPPPRQQKRTPPPEHFPESGVGSFLRNLLPKDFCTEDLLIVLLLLLMAGDCQEDQNTALLTLALYLFL